MKSSSLPQVVELRCPSGVYYILDEGPFVVNDRLKTAFTYLWAIVGFFLPVATLVYCNVHLVRALRESHRMRRMYRVNNARATSCGSRVTPTLVAVVCMYLVLMTPAELLQFYYYAVRPAHVEIFTAAIVATNVLQTMNFAFNFVLYCIVNVHFREASKELVFCRSGEAEAARRRRRDLSRNCSPTVANRASIMKTPPTAFETVL